MSKIRVASDKKVVITPNIAHFNSETQELKLLREWIQKFEEFVANHKDMANSYYSIVLEITEEFICDNCGYTWASGSKDRCVACGELAYGQ